MRAIQLASLFIVVASLAFIANSAEAGRRGHPILQPDPIDARSKSMTEIRKAVRKAFVKRGWSVRNQGNTAVVASYSKFRSSRKGDDITYKATVRADFKDGIIRFKYVSSEHLDYDAAAGTIHGTYNRWLQNVVTGVRSYLNIY